MAQCGNCNSPNMYRVKIVAIEEDDYTVEIEEDEPPRGYYCPDCGIFVDEEMM